MLKYFQFKHFSISKKLSLWGGVLLLFLFMIVIINNNQFKILGIETVKITSTELPAIREVNKLDMLIYQQTILRYLISSQVDSTVNERQSRIANYTELSQQIAIRHEKISSIMNDYAKLEMPTTKRRWKRLQTEHQQALQASFDLISKTHSEHKAIAEKSFLALSSGELDNAKNLQSQLIDLDILLHLEVEKLSLAAINGVVSSGKKMENIEYGARQMTYFLLFWFYLIGIVIGFFIIRMIVTRIKQAAELATKISVGEYGDHVDVTSQDELGNLTKTLIAIAQSLDKKISPINSV